MRDTLAATLGNSNMAGRGGRQGRPLGRRRVARAAQGQGRYWRTAFRFALDEIGAIVGLATDKPKRPPVPERYAFQVAVMVTMVGKGAP